MTRRHPGDLLSAWLDGELTSNEQVAVAAHLQDCPACSAERDEIAAGRAMLRGLPLLLVPSEVLVARPAVHVGDLISALLDEELDADLVPGIGAHLAVCPACTAEYDEVAWARTAVRGLPQLDPPLEALKPAAIVTVAKPPAPRGVPAPIGPRANRGPSRVPARRLRPRQVVAASMAVAAVGLGVLGLVGRSTPVDPSRPAVATFVAQHSTSQPGPDAVSGLAPAAVPVSFTR